MPIQLTSCSRVLIRVSFLVLSDVDGLSGIARGQAGAQWKGWDVGVPMRVRGGSRGVCGAFGGPRQLPFGNSATPAIGNLKPFLKVFTRMALYLTATI